MKTQRWAIVALALLAEFSLVACEGGRDMLVATGSGFTESGDERLAGIRAEDDPLGLLGNPGKRYYVSQQCDGAPDEAVIDHGQDPRRLLLPNGEPGSANLIDSEDYAVHFNDPFEICHTDTLFETQARQNELRVAMGEEPFYTAKRDPETCGEWRQRVQNGLEFMTFVPGDQPPNGDHSRVNRVIPALDWNNLWRLWGYEQRPTDFDEQLYERYGVTPPPEDMYNPYPIVDPARGIDERPLLTKDFGGSGRLPLSHAQGRDADGSYSGALGVTCLTCHSGQLGEGEILARDGNGNEAIFGGNPNGTLFGLPNTNMDYGVMLADLIHAKAYGPTGSVPAQVPVTSVGYLPVANATRGVEAADTGIEYMTLTRDWDSLDANNHVLPVPVHGNTGDLDVPAWWWFSNKTRYLWFGGHSSDSSRGNMYFASVNTLDGPQIKAKEGDYDDLHQWILSLEAPDYPAGFCTGANGAAAAGDHPGCINKSQAMQGSILFHEKDLWANEQNADIPRPKGNGSCAACHGAYAPRYINDERFLPDPRLAGTVGYTVPIEIIDTDPALTEGWSREIRSHVSTWWWAYADAVEGYLLPEEKTRAAEILDDYAWAGVDGADVADKLSRQFDHLGILEPIGDSLSDAFWASLGQAPAPGAGEAMGRIRGACTFEEKTIGYVAPPLHGVWASAPYFHNGSVPTVWEVLDPDVRPGAWRRQRTTTPVHFNGFESRLHGQSSGYDWDNMGWNYDRMDCGDAGQGIPYYTCQPATEAPPEILWGTDTLLGGLLWPTWIVPPPVGEQGLEDRMIFSTNLYSKKNRGHEWTRALSDAERRALVEYMKTL